MALISLNHIKNRLRAIFTQSIRHQLVWSFVVVTTVGMFSFSALMFYQQRSFLNRADVDSATGLARALASSSVSWVIADDVVGLQEVVAGFSGNPDFKFAMILTPEGEVLAASDQALSGQYASDKISQRLMVAPAEYQVLINNHALIDVAQPIMSGSRHLGWARVELSKESTANNIARLGWTSLVLSLLGVLSALIVAWLLAKRLTRSLYHLWSLTRLVESGKHDARAVIEQQDEVGALASSFNKMLDTLDVSESQLNRMNRLYAAWTECSAILVREKDEEVLLNRICATLADRVPFTLVWVGVPNEAGWLEPVASGGDVTDYLPTVRVAVSADFKEGHGPFGSAIREGVPKVLNDFLDDERAKPWRSHALQYGHRAVAAFPLFRGGECYGGIAVYSGVKDYFTPEMIGLMTGLAEDITFALDSIDLAAQQRLSQVKLEQAATVFEHSKEGILVADTHNTILSVNKAFTQITGYPAVDVIGKKPSVLSSGRHDEAFYQQMWKSILTEGSWQGEIWNRRKDGEVFPEMLTIIAVRDASGEVVNYLAMSSDISERKLAEERIKQLAHFDVLTGLPNRVLFADRLNQAMLFAQRNQSKLSLLFLDLDRFKQINDTLGHGVGDQLLQMVAQRLLACVREQDTVSRQGGDEFIIVLVNTEQAGAELVADKILQSIIQPYMIEGHELRISSSVGVATYPDHAQDGDMLIKYADVAMYKAKEGGRNRYLSFEATMNASAYERLKLETALRVAVERNELRLVYQPQVDLVDGHLVGCEALVRWQHPELGMVSPANFIPIAEETGLIANIGDWVLEEAIRQCSAWRAAGLPDLMMAVNLSALQFKQRNLVDQVDKLLDKYSLPARFLELELTEGILMQGVEKTLTDLHNLTAMGVTLAIDDFGTGYSSLSYLKRFPLQKLKIDQSFVRDITVDSDDAAMVKTIILMAQSLKLDVIAEGVETDAQAQFLHQSGCCHAQGYYFGRPMSAQDFELKYKEAPL